LCGIGPLDGRFTTTFARAEEKSTAADRAGFVLQCSNAKEDGIMHQTPRMVPDGGGGHRLEVRCGKKLFKNPLPS
jgi:hypothetical protein